MALTVAHLDSPSPVERFLAMLGQDRSLVHVERLGARGARYAELSTPLPPTVRDRLGIDRFWSHQARAIDLARSGASVAISTGTASGKSMCFQAPIAEAVVTGTPAGTALLLFPTKALAQDQLRSMTGLDVPGLVAATYDGDCSLRERAWVRANANVVLTNPEMLHAGILPNHARWAPLLSNLRFVVVDELHALRGVFGTHVAHLLRRLRRLCVHYGSDPSFVFCSATIGEPGRLASELCGVDVIEVTDDGSPRGERLFALWNPLDMRSTGFESRAASGNSDTARLVCDLITSGHRTISFCRSRKGAEIVAADVRRRLPVPLDRTVRSYRSGYLNTERRDIERELLDGTLRGVVATTALELGVDIGGLDACVLNGFPGTIASMWQQAGRAGRDTQPSVSVLVAGDDQLDQWLMAHPEEVFSRAPEPAVINPANPHLLLPHLSCAAYELPLSHVDERWWPGLLDDGVRRLVLHDQLRIRGRSRAKAEPVAVWAGRGRPASGVGLRSGSTDEFRIATPDGRLVGTVDRPRAFTLVHPGAIYLHQGQSYRVQELDIDDLTALVEPTEGGEYTQARSQSEITILAEHEHGHVGVAHLGLGQVTVRSRVTGYRRFDSRTGEMLGAEDLFLPPGELETTAFWWTVTPEVLEACGIVPSAVAGTLHALEHAAIGMLPLFTICDRWDVGGASTPLQADTGRPTVVIHDAYPGGAGIAELGFRAAEHLLTATREVISSCRCTMGCPSCVQSPKCGNGNEPLDKSGALGLLAGLLG